MKKKKTKHGGRRKGAGRPPQHDEPTISRGLRIPVKLDNEIQKEADRNKTSWSQMVIYYLGKAMSR